MKVKRKIFLTKQPRTKPGLMTFLAVWNKSGQTIAKVIVLISQCASFNNIIFSISYSGFSQHTCSHFTSFSPLQEQLFWALEVSTEFWPAVRPDQDEVRRPLSSTGSGSATWKGLTHTHTHTSCLFIHIGKARADTCACAHTHTHAHNLPHPHIDMCIQKHTCQGLSTVWAKAKKSGPPSVSLYVVSHVCYIKANLFSSHFLIWNNGMSNFHI